MSESAAHLYLVNALVVWVSTTFLSGNFRDILVDSSGRDLTNKPHMIGNYIPDVLVASMNCEKFIIGEAKTAHDLENDHTLKQMETFLLACSEKENSIFVLAVPWHMTRRARSIIKFIKNEKNINYVATEVIERLSG